MVTAYFIECYYHITKGTKLLIYKKYSSIKHYYFIDFSGTKLAQFRTKLARFCSFPVKRDMLH